MEQRVKAKLFVSILICTALLAPSAIAATPNPSPKSSSTAKPATSNPTSTPKASAVSTSTKKPTKKPVKKKKRVKKTATPIPSPSPIWPPVGFTASSGIYAKIPTGKELLGLLSAKAGLASDVKKCETNACGAVVVAADIQCRWWEIKSTVLMVDPADANKKIALGNLRTTYNSLSPKTYANILLISDEPMYSPKSIDPVTNQEVPPVARTGISVGNISAICHKSATEEKIPSSVYTPVK